MSSRPSKPPPKPKQQASFDVGKRNALSKLAEADKSPKGSLDIPIAPLVRHTSHARACAPSGGPSRPNSPPW